MRVHKKEKKQFVHTAYAKFKRYTSKTHAQLNVLPRDYFAGRTEETNSLKLRHI